MTYLYCKKLITNTMYTTQAEKDEMQQKLDIFLLNNRITEANYNELTTMLTEKPLVG